MAEKAQSHVQVGFVSRAALQSLDTEERGTTSQQLNAQPPQVDNSDEESGGGSLGSMFAVM